MYERGEPSGPIVELAMDEKGRITTEREQSGTSTPISEVAPIDEYDAFSLEDVQAEFDEALTRMTEGIAKIEKGEDAWGEIDEMLLSLATDSDSFSGSRKALLEAVSRGAITEEMSELVTDRLINFSIRSQVGENFVPTAVPKFLHQKRFDLARDPELKKRVIARLKKSLVEQTERRAVELRKLAEEVEELTAETNDVLEQIDIAA